MNIRKHSGLTLIGFVMVLSLVVFTVFIGMRLAPMYLEYHAAVNALETLSAERGSAELPAHVIRQRIQASMYVSYATNTLTSRDIKITRGNGVTVRIAYESRRPLIANLDVVGKFDKSVVLR